ncbi:MAG: hypothetical protein ABIP75_05250, partial [Pyrinomonadaceae bacterium]
MLIGTVAGQESPGQVVQFDKWVTQTSSEGGFTVKFPARPSTKQLSRSSGTVEIIRHVIAMDTKQNRHFEVNYVDLKGGSANPDALRRAGLDGFVNALVEQGGQLLSRTKINQGLCAGE